MTLLALDAYAGANAAGLDKLSIQALPALGAGVAIGKVTGNLLEADGWNTGTAKLRFINGNVRTMLSSIQGQ